MDLNSVDSVFNKVSQMSDDELKSLDTHVYLVSKAQESDKYYEAKKENLNSELREWLKKNIRLYLKELKVDDQNQECGFPISPYNYETKKNDYIAEIDLNQEESSMEHIVVRKNKLLSSLNTSSTNPIQDSEVKMQVVKITISDSSAYLIYYRGVKEHSIKKKGIKKLVAVRRGNVLEAQSGEVIEFGGNIELLIEGDSIFVINPNTLEYSFDYRDHIMERRDNNLNAIMKMSFFDQYSSAEEFEENAKKYIVSKGIAGITKETLLVLEEKFEDRCKDLEKIKEQVPTNEEQKQEYMKRYASLWPLYSHIDIDNRKVRFNTNESITPLLHFFSDKIVESFLTKTFHSGR